MAADHSLRKQLAAHLDSMMQANPSLGTNAKLARRAGISMNTVRRVRIAEETDVSIAGFPDSPVDGRGLVLRTALSPKWHPRWTGRFQGSLAASS